MILPRSTDAEQASRPMIHDERHAELLNAALQYAAYGIKIVPAHEPLFDDNGDQVGCTCEEHKRSQSYSDWLDEQHDQGRLRHLRYDPNFVCRSPGKHPRVSDWENKATTKRDQIMGWWAKWPTANIAIPAGANGFLLIDNDTYKDHYKGADLLSVDEQQTPTVLSGGGGTNLIFRMPEDKCYGNQTGDLPPGIDIRGCGGQFIAPPSIHPSGNLYQWENDYSIYDLEPVPLPATIEAKLAAAAEVNKKVTPAIFSTDHPPQTDLTPWHLAQVTLELINNPLAKGKRSHADGSVIMALCNKGLTDDEILGVFVHYPIGQQGKFAEDGIGYLARSIGTARAKIAANPPINPTIPTGRAAVNVTEFFKETEPIAQAQPQAQNLDLKWVTEYTELMTSLTGSPWEFNRLAGLVIVATALERKYTLNMSFAQVAPNLYGAIIAPSSVFHKSAALGKVPRMLDKAGYAHSLLANQFTPEGLLKQLVAQNTGVIVNDEIGRLFTSHKTKYLEALKPDLTAYYDGGTVKRQLSKESITVIDPCLNIIGATTPKVFFEGVTPLDWQSGLLARWMFVRPTNAIPNFTPGRFLDNDDGLISLDRSAIPENKLAESLKKLGQKEGGAMVCSPGADQYWYDWYDRKMRAAYDHGDDIVTSFEQRSTTYALKFAILLAAMDGRKAITLGNMETAIALAEQYTQTARDMMQEHTEWGISGDKMQKVLKYIKLITTEGKEATTSALMKRCNMSKNEITPVLDELAKIGAVLKDARHTGHAYVALVDQLLPQMGRSMGNV